MNEPSGLKTSVPLAGVLASVAVRLALSASLSLASTLPLTAVSSAVVKLSSTATGASFTAAPTNVSVPFAVNSPSLRLRAVVAVPLKLAAGVKTRPTRAALSVAVVPLAVYSPGFAPATRPVPLRAPAEAGLSVRDRVSGPPSKSMAPMPKLRAVSSV